MHEKYDKVPCRVPVTNVIRVNFTGNIWSKYDTARKAVYDFLLVTKNDYIPTSSIL